MLALFALGVTPKIAIHDLVAHHQDTHLSLDHGKAAQLKGQWMMDEGRLYDQVVGRTMKTSHIQLGVRPSFPVHGPVSLEEPVSFTHPLFGLRGPPAA